MWDISSGKVGVLYGRMAAENPIELAKHLTQKKFILKIRKSPFK